MDLLEFTGHFHPVLVHLPIGILLAAILFEWLSYRKGFRKLRKAIRLLFLLGFLSALVSSATGYLLSRTGDYDQQLLTRHQWLGYTVTVISLIAFLLCRRKQPEVKVGYGVIVFSLAILLLLTGHAGGSLTHGTDFLTPPPMADWFGSGKDKQYVRADLKSALFYKDVIAPILHSKCVRCHGPSKQKGKLRLDKAEYILKGGKDGSVVQPSKVDSESELVRRIQLDLIDEDHMPPKEKSQLTKEEIDLIVYWVSTGANFEKPFMRMPGADSMINLLASHSIGSGADDPIPEVEMPDDQLLEKLRAGGIAVSFLARDNGLASLNFVNADTTRLSALLVDIVSMKRQIWELKMAGCKFSHQDWAMLSSLHSLRRLNLENSNVADQDLLRWKVLSNLRYLNLSGTSVTASGLESFSPCSSLRRMFLYHSGVTGADFPKINGLFPEAVIDTGNYQVPTFYADTTQLSKPYSSPKM